MGLATWANEQAMAEKILIGIDVVGVLLILALDWFVYRGFHKCKKQQG